MRLGLAVLILALAPGASDSAETERWLGAFVPFPGARRLCTQQVLGQSEGRRMEIHFTLYATRREPREAARFYALAHGLDWKPEEQAITVKAGDGRKVLAVQRASEPHPECGVEPKPEDRTVIVVSERVP
jgi:hypothetical protein